MVLNMHQEALMTEYPAVEFLRKTHQRLERVARALPSGPWMWNGHNGPEGRYMALEGPAEVPAIRSRSKDEQGSWLEWHPAFDEFLPDPSAMLLRIEAEREILAEHGIVHREIGWLMDEGSDEVPVCGRCVPKHSHFPRREDIPEGPCKTVLALAKAWGWKGA